jgi:hypothetical protein
MQSSADERLDKGDAPCNADGRFLVLKTVTRANLNDSHLLAHGDGPPAG